MIESDLFSPEDAVELARQVTAGLAHLHQHGVYHCDIKPTKPSMDRPRHEDNRFQRLGPLFIGKRPWRRLAALSTAGSRPIPRCRRQSDLADRDLYALGVTLFEAVTGRYPWKTAVPPAGKPAPDPASCRVAVTLRQSWSDVDAQGYRAERADRFVSAAVSLALSWGASAKQARRVRYAPSADVSTSWTPGRRW